MTKNGVAIALIFLVLFVLLGLSGCVDQGRGCNLIELWACAS